jgi:hypothetical protein
MDPATIKSSYGDKMVLYGSLDVEDGLLTHDGPALAEYITQRFHIYAPGGGFIFDTGHFVQPDIPPQRLLAAYQVVNELARQHGAGQPVSQNLELWSTAYAKYKQLRTFNFCTLVTNWSPL